MKYTKFIFIVIVIVEHVYKISVKCSDLVMFWEIELLILVLIWLLSFLDDYFLSMMWLLEIALIIDLLQLFWVNGSEYLIRRKNKFKCVNRMKSVIKVWYHVYVCLNLRQHQH